MVILVHCVVTWTPEFSVGFQNLLLVPMSGRAPVILFFVLSGFVLASSFDGYSLRAVTGYYVRRLFRIVPLAWVGLLIALLVAALTRQWVPDLPLSDWLRPTFTASADRLPGCRAGPGCLDSAPLDLSGFLPGYAERGALRFCRCVGRA
ncbi:acyltransferase family protein [Bradyrhizobium daqingense]